MWTILTHMVAAWIGAVITVVYIAVVKTGREADEKARKIADEIMWGKEK